MSSVPSVPPPPTPSTGTLGTPPAAPAPPDPAPLPAAAPPAPPQLDARKPDADHPPLPPVHNDYAAAVLSYLIPGLGQVYQGRIGKGLLFFAGLYTLFFYGMAMGQWRNVWLPDATDLPEVEIAGRRLGGVSKALSYRPQFLAQFWMGIAAWPAVVQYATLDPTKEAGPVFGTFQRAPSEDALNKLQREGNKRWDLGWVYTVIAGVLNLLVIYDALAGPMYREPPPGWEKKTPAPAGW